jgi:hypothetical protein
MVELEYRAGLAYPAPVVFGALTDVPRYPAWWSDIAAATVRGGGPLRLGAEITQVRRSLGRRNCLCLTVEDYEQDRLLVLGTATGTRPRLQETFRLRPGPVSGCCVVGLRVVLDDVPLLAEALEAMITHQVIGLFDSLRSHLVASSAIEDGACEELSVPHDPLPDIVNIGTLRALVQPEHTPQRHRSDQRIRQVLG